VLQVSGQDDEIITKLTGSARLLKPWLAGGASESTRTALAISKLVAVPAEVGESALCDRLSTKKLAISDRGSVALLLPDVLFVRPCSSAQWLRTSVPSTSPQSRVVFSVNSEIVVVVANDDKCLLFSISQDADRLVQM